MAECLEQASQWYKMYCHDLEVMSSNWLGLFWIERVVLLSQVVIEQKVQIWI